MRHILLAIMLATSSLTAQGGDILYSHLDAPSEDQVVSRAAFAVHGWAFNCSRGGQQPFFVQVRIFTSAPEPVVIQMRRYAARYRPDVQAAFAGTCPGMSAYTGFVLVPTDWSALPTGTVTLVVEHADSNGATYNQRRVTLQ